MENRIEKMKRMLSDYAECAGESSVKRSQTFSTPDDIYKSLDNQAAARVSIMSGYNGSYLRFYIIKAFMYGYFTALDDSVIARIDDELDKVAPIIFELSMQDAIDCGYLG